MMTPITFKKASKFVLRLIIALGILYCVAYFLIFGVFGYVDYIKKAQVTRVYGKMSAVKTAV